MATKIKLMRLGKMRAPYYRIVVADARTKRDGRSIETIGKYHPKENPSFIEVDSDRAQYWLGVGAQPTEAVAAILALAAVAEGVPPERMGSHSLRIGGATAMYHATMDLKLVQRYGRWLSDSFQGYLYEAHEMVRGLAAEMGRDDTELIHPR